ncbi:hypothetical protein [Arthrobacter sp. SLBN-53]|uniref:hypothetical protein n=1 Tax=Arthrobacter sp. SLBN-53 TaxID=2768412 RepID=UPI001152E2B6|nr:hypothetical protein [Arthrobacter sp. SLBN-53]TQK29381.1 hypothetical protein FBY28_2384 [Arthrobacter sp. SLBN-53]
MPFPLDPQGAGEVIPQRDNGSDGNPVWQDLPETRIVIALDKPVLVDGKGSRYTQSGSVAVPRGYDLKHGDRIPFDGAYLTVFGRPQGNHDHPVTGDDFGWVIFAVQAGG